jgi:hypothetical protein
MPTLVGRIPPIRRVSLGRQIDVRFRTQKCRDGSLFGVNQASPTGHSLARERAHRLTIGHRDRKRGLRFKASRWPQWFLQCFEQFRQMNKFLQINNGQHLPSSGRHLVPYKKVEMHASIGDHDAL